jgi:glycosyltransferase involved in cell wall biosynthesis
MEGWGLPVEESLEQGKLCVASDRGAIPEVGGDLIDYFDVADDASALAAIERAIFDHDHRAEREVRIHREFHPRSWADCVAMLVAHLDCLCAEPEPRAIVGARDVV